MIRAGEREEYAVYPPQEFFRLRSHELLLRIVAHERDDVVEHRRYIAQRTRKRADQRGMPRVRINLEYDGNAGRAELLRELPGVAFRIDDGIALGGAEERARCGWRRINGWEPGG
jgi:hypothetical protein